MDEEYDSEVDIDMSQQPSGSAQSIMNIDGLDDTEIFGEQSNALQLDLSDLTLSDMTSDTESRAPTPPYVNPASIVEATVRWATTGESRFPPRSRSNERIESILHSNQQWLRDHEMPTDPRFGTLISPAATGRSLTPESFLTGPDENTLDWGSCDEEQYVFSSLRTSHADDVTELALPPKSQGDGKRNGYVYLRESHVLVPKSLDMYNISSALLDLLECEHNEYFSQCAECIKRTQNMWLLDSGASAHFTNNLSDFIEYKPIAKSERMPVKTAAQMLYVEGTGSVLLEHYVADKPVITRVYPVLYIPRISIRLLSMGVFLQQGLRVLGNSQHINLLRKNKKIVQCKPLLHGQSLYWLDASISTLTESHIANQSALLNVDYDLMHRRLGHPSKEVLRRAKENTKGFPEGIIIPSSDVICPGCAQGKMPAASHPLLIQGLKPLSLGFIPI
jgi:hypothetical protein